MNANTLTRIRTLFFFGVIALTVSLLPRTNAAGLLIADGGFGGNLEITEQDITITVNNGIAVTEVVQVFKNLENRQVEALYTFPVPNGATVSNFSMWINGKEMIGEVLEKQRARKIYESYKKTRRDPGLLEQKDYKTFEMRIFPINAKASQRVKLRYYQELGMDNDWATYVYPLATSTRQVVSNRTTGRFAINLNVKSEIPITKMESPSHTKDFVIAKHSDNYYQASLETRGGDLNKDVVLAYQIKRPKSGIDVICSKTNREDGYFCMTITAGKELDRLKKGMDYVFLLDISGSMEHDGKMVLSKNSIDAFINELDTEDRFELMTFNVGPKPLFKQMQQVSPATLKQGTEFLQSREAKGGTDLRPAIMAAYKYSNPDRVLNVVILSDGMTEQRTQNELLTLIQQHPRNARVFCIGVGNDVNRPLLKQIAEKAGGLAAFISRGDNFKRQAKAFRRKLLRPAISNIALDFPSKVYDIEPKVIPNLYHGMPVRVYGRYKGNGQIDVNLKGTIGSHQFSKTFKADLPSGDDRNPEIDRMWAWHKMQRLNDLINTNGRRDNLVNEIVRLGEAYSIAGEYTSFLVLENNAEYKRWKINQRNVLRIKRDRVSREDLNRELKSIRTQAANKLVPLESAQEEKAPVRSNRQVQLDRPSQISRPVPVSSPSPTRKRRRRNSFDFGIGGGGGGALDPISIILLLAEPLAAFVSQPVRRNNNREPLADRQVRSAKGWHQEL